MDKCGYGIAIFRDEYGPIFYVATVKKDSTYHYHGFLSPYVEDAKEFQFVKTCKDICRDILETMPDYKACCFKFQK